MICGAIVNMFGPRVILSAAALGYPTCIAIFWVYHIYGHIAILVLDAALLGCCTALAWTCSTFVAYAYPVRQSKHPISQVYKPDDLIQSGDRKGRYISVQWGTVNLACKYHIAIVVPTAY
jgi:hypothetical protein